jgi:hypothetical protein
MKKYGYQSIKNIESYNLVFNIITEIETKKLINHYNISILIANTLEKIAIENQTKAKESNLFIKLQTLTLNLNLPNAIN